MERNSEGSAQGASALPWAAIHQLLSQRREEALQLWLSELVVRGGARGLEGSGRTAINARDDALQLIHSFLLASQSDAPRLDFSDIVWDPLRAVLEQVSASRAAQGATAGDTSRFVLAFKKPLFQALHQHLGDNAAALSNASWEVSSFVDGMAQFTIDVYQATREAVIKRQQADLLELSTPVIKLWDGILAVPMIGTLDSGRTQLVMQALLERLVETESDLAIIDITGVPTVDTLVAQHLLKTVTAIRLMGADCIISGIRPQIAQTIVHLGIDLQGIMTQATLASALRVALQKTGYVVTRAKPGAA